MGCGRPLAAVVLALVVVHLASARKHHLSVEKDPRRFFPISTFGFYTRGFLSVNVTNFHIETIITPETDDSKVILGFSIDKTSNDALNPYMETSEARCILGPDRPLPGTSGSASEDAILRFILDLKNNKTKVECSDNIQSITILPNRDKLNEILAKNEQGGVLSDSAMFQSVKQPKSKREAGQSNRCKDVSLPLIRGVTSENKVYFNASFVIYIANEKEEGLYSFYFHNCHNYERDLPDIPVSFDVEIEEKNYNSYLSAGEMPLPALYLLMSCLFFLSGCFWVFILRKNGSENVYRIHWIMASLVFLKSLSLLFHGINYHKIETHGYHIESWAILYYITHLLKGGLLFFTIVLIGSGWAFVKHVLSDKEKRVFIIVLPLQVLANVAYIIMEESEEGEARHNWWKELFILVDLLCCGAILFPVVWSIRHLQDASQSDGKVTISLEKLKLFRHFYIMVVCYIYFTRIIVYLMKITVPFQYEYLDESFREVATFAFFVMTGYKFRPASSNPYFSVATDDYDMEEVLIASTAVSDTVTSRKKRLLADDEDSEDDMEGMVYFPSSSRKTESSHDFD